MDFTLILEGIAVLGIMGAVFGALLAFAAKIFHVEVDPKQEAVRECLAGANCGGCGYPGCDGYAAAVAAGQAPVNCCVAGGQEAADKIAAIMGVSAGAEEKMVAFVPCSGAEGVAVKRFNYKGPQDCQAAMLFGGKSNDFITAVDEKSIIIVKELKDTDTFEDMNQTARMLVDMLNAEAMSQVRVSYGNPVNEIKSVSRSYKEAKMALEVGKIFYADKNVVPYNNLGIGRLIYQLPIPLCEMFMTEVFGENLPDTFDEETLTTINKFFENNLNVSETSRQLYVHRNTLVYRLEKLEKSTGLDIRKFDDALTFKIAMMVVSYMTYMNNSENL